MTSSTAALKRLSWAALTSPSKTLRWTWWRYWRQVRRIFGLRSASVSYTTMTYIVTTRYGTTVRGVLETGAGELERFEMKQLVIGHVPAETDRKSTRLNSSHLGISYA